MFKQSMIIINKAALDVRGCIMKGENISTIRKSFDYVKRIECK